MGHSVDRHGPKPIHRSGHPEFVEPVAEDPLLSLEHGQRLFAEGDVPTCMYIVKTGQLQIRSGGVTYEDVGPGGIIGEMGVIETQELRSATVYAVTDSELVEINDARFARLIARGPKLCHCRDADAIPSAASDGSPGPHALGPRAGENGELLRSQSFYISSGMGYARHHQREGPPWYQGGDRRWNGGQR
jgi:hypothetical protein